MVVASPLNLKKVTTSASDSQKKVTEARSSVKNIGQVILKRTKVKRESFAQTNLFRKRREENEKRMMLEDELEAPRVAISFFKLTFFILSSRNLWKRISSDCWTLVVRNSYRTASGIGCVNNALSIKWLEY